MLLLKTNIRTATIANTMKSGYTSEIITFLVCIYQTAVFDCIPCKDKRPELFARFIRNNTEGKGQLFTDIDELGNFPDYPKLIEKYNDSLYSGHRPESDLMLEHNQVFIASIELVCVYKLIQARYLQGN